MSIDFASFDLAELDVLDSTDAVALPEMGASIIIIFPVTNNTEDGDEVLGDDALNGSGSASTSSS